MITMHEGRVILDNTTDIFVGGNGCDIVLGGGSCGASLSSTGPGFDEADDPQYIQRNDERS